MSTNYGIILEKCKQECESQVRCIQKCIERSIEPKAMANTGTDLNFGLIIVVVIISIIIMLIIARLIYIFSNRKENKDIEKENKNDIVQNRLSKDQRFVAANFDSITSIKSNNTENYLNEFTFEGNLITSEKISPLLDVPYLQDGPIIPNLDARDNPILPDLDLNNTDPKVEISDIPNILYIKKHKSPNVIANDRFCESPYIDLEFSEMDLSSSVFNNAHKTI